jgi:amino acid transporter
VAEGPSLSQFGIKEQLERRFGTFTNFALSFSIISVLTGAVSLYGHGLAYGGPLAMTVGWPVVSCFTLAIALSLAELASAYPTAGALYHWSTLLGGRGLGWLTAWLNTLGQFAITAAIDYGLAELLVALLGLPSDRRTTLGLTTVLLVSHGAINHWGASALRALTTVSAWYHVGGVLALIAAVGFFGDRQPLQNLLSLRTQPGVAMPMSLALCLLQAGWTFTGYDASAHASEETIDAARAAPRGLVMSVVVSALVGWLMVLAVTLAMTDIEATIQAKSAFLFILHERLGRIGDALTWVCAGAMWFCGLGSVTSNSRMLFAFARDGGLPFSAQLARVSSQERVPHFAIWASVAAAFVVTLAGDALAVMAALSTVALYVSYALPIAACALRRRTGYRPDGPFSLGRWGLALNVVALVWVAFMGVVMSVPPNGLAGLTLIGCCALLGLLWLTRAKALFRPDLAAHVDSS